MAMRFSRSKENLTVFYNSENTLLKNDIGTLAAK